MRAATLALAGFAALFLVPTASARTLQGTAGPHTIRGTDAADKFYAGDGPESVSGLREPVQDSQRNKRFCGRGRDRAVANTYGAMARCQYGGPPSFFVGPAGRWNRVPAAGAFLGLWREAGLSEMRARSLLRSRERFFGRKIDEMAEHYGAPRGRCYSIAPFSKGSERWNWKRGVYTAISWSPGYSISDVNSGAVDACFRKVARRFKAFGHPVWLRLWWEFNGDWFRWSYDPQNPQVFIAAWRRVVRIFKHEGVRKTMFTWCPAEGYYDPNSRPSGYPGDGYVDWVCSDGYNWSASDAWCGSHAGWCEFSEIFHNGDARARSVEGDFRNRKPYLVGEHGSIEDPYSPRRKQQWFLNERERIKTQFPNLRALFYFERGETRDLARAGSHPRLSA